MDKNSSLMQSENSSYTNSANDRQIKYAKPHYNLGKALAKKGEWEEAIASYQKAIELAPNWEEVRQSLAEAKEKLGGKTVPESSNKKRSNPSNPHYNLGKVLEQKGELIEAIAHYQKAIEIEPKNPEIYNSLGDIFQKKGDLEAGIKAYQKATEIEPNFWEVHHKLGNCWQEVGNLDDALVAYQKSIELNADFSWSYNNLALGGRDSRRDRRLGLLARAAVPVGSERAHEDGSEEIAVEAVAVRVDEGVVGDVDGIGVHSPVAVVA
ncbi:MAG: tetratricopeptide repeat protein, partial [Okeania sp. SIO2H7]|nr:tetratricopeptide repeat protein [Okeania sp. SIO2H7]